MKSVGHWHCHYDANVLCCGGATLGTTCSIQGCLSMLVLCANLLFTAGLFTCSHLCKDSPTLSNRFIDNFLTCRLAPAHCWHALAHSCISVYLFAAFIASTQCESSTTEVEFSGLKEMSRRYQLSFGMLVRLVFARISTSHLTSLSIRWRRNSLV